MTFTNKQVERYSRQISLKKIGVVGQKKLLKSKEIGEDDEKSFEKNVQNITDKHIALVDEKVSTKEKEIMTI